MPIHIAINIMIYFAFKKSTTLYPKNKFMIHLVVMGANQVIMCSPLSYIQQMKMLRKRKFNVVMLSQEET